MRLAAAGAAGSDTGHGGGAEERRELWSRTGDKSPLHKVGGSGGNGGDRDLVRANLGFCSEPRWWPQ